MASIEVATRDVYWAYVRASGLTVASFLQGHVINPRSRRTDQKLIMSAELSAHREYQHPGDSTWRRNLANPQNPEQIWNERRWKIPGSFLISISTDPMLAGTGNSTLAYGTRNHHDPTSTTPQSTQQTLRLDGVGLNIRGTAPQADATEVPNSLSGFFDSAVKHDGTDIWLPNQSLELERTSPGEASFQYHGSVVLARIDI